MKKSILYSTVISFLQFNLAVVTTLNIPFDEFGAFDRISSDKQEADNLDLIINYLLPAVQE